MSTFSDAIDAALATLPAAPVPAAPAVDDFGSDLSCADDITATADELAADDPLVVAQALYRALLTIPGTLPDLEVKDWGIGLQLYLRRATTPSQLAALPGILQSRAMVLDDRIQALAVTIAPEGNGRHRLAMRGSTARGPFALVMSASPSDVLLKAMTGP